MILTAVHRDPAGGVIVALDDHRPLAAGLTTAGLVGHALVLAAAVIRAVPRGPADAAGASSARAQAAVLEALAADVAQAQGR